MSACRSGYDVAAGSRMANGSEQDSPTLELGQARKGRSFSSPSGTPVFERRATTRIPAVRFFDLVRPPPRTEMVLASASRTQRPRRRDRGYGISIAQPRAGRDPVRAATSWRARQPLTFSTSSQSCRTTMAKTSRRSISISSKTYNALRDHCSMVGSTMSGQVERWIVQRLAEYQGASGNASDPADQMPPSSMQL
jgi:hypothetical protein